MTFFYSTKIEKAMLKSELFWPGNKCVKNRNTIGENINIEL